VVELDTVVGAQHKEGHCDGTRREKAQIFVCNVKVACHRIIKCSLHVKK
jgi:hypothetical protein